MVYSRHVHPLDQDTSPAQQREYFRLLRELTPRGRLLIASAATRRMRMMALAGVRLRNPEATEAQARLELARLLYGPEAARRIACATAP
jgi:hypothetical protein